MVWRAYLHPLPESREEGFLYPEVILQQYTEVIEHYTEYDEAGRLFRSRSCLERIRTQELLLRHLPPAPAKVADIGGGPGVHAFWLAEQGYQVSLLDLTPRHIEQVRTHAAASGIPLEDIREGDGRALPYADASFDVALLCGPLYHLPERDDRLQALREARRVLRPDGMLFAAILSRFSPMMDHMLLGSQILEEHMVDFLRIISVGYVIKPPAFTTAYFHLPQEAREEAGEAGFKVEHLYAIESIGGYLPNFDAVLEDPAALEHMLRMIRQVEEHEALLGASAHQLLVARK